MDMCSPSMPRRPPLPSVKKDGLAAVDAFLRGFGGQPIRYPETDVSPETIIRYWRAGYGLKTLGDTP